MRLPTSRNRFQNVRRLKMPWRLGLIFAVLAVLLLLPTSRLSACKFNQEQRFPTLNTTLPIETSDNQGSTETTSDKEQKTLTVALPIGDDALKALRLLFLARQSGLLNQEPGQYIGQSIQLSDLQQFEGPLTINLINVSQDTGVTKDQIADWQAAGNMPDIIYCLNAATSPGLSQALDLNDYLFASPLLTAEHIYPSALKSSHAGKILYGIPYLASVPLIYLNQSLLGQYQMLAPSISWTWQNWLEYSSLLQTRISEAGYGATPDILANLAIDPVSLNDQLKKSIYVFDNPASLLQFLPASLNPNLGWATWNDQQFAFQDDSFLDAANWLNQYTQAGMTPLHLDNAQQLAAFSGADAIQSSRVCMWLGNSSELAAWHQQTRIKISESLVPCSPAEIAAGESATPDSQLNLRMPLQVRSLIVNKTTDEPELAAEFAAFLALDADSLLIQSRYQLYEGFVPVVKEDVIWEAMVERQLYGRLLQDLQAKMPYAYCSNQQLSPNWNRVLNSAIGFYGKELMTAADASEIDSIMEQLIIAAKKLS